MQMNLRLTASRRPSVLQPTVASLCGIWLILSIGSASWAENAPKGWWPQFRGPGGDGIATSSDVPLRLDAAGHQRWRTELPGKAWSSPVVADDVIWVTTAVEVAPDDAERQRMLEETGLDARKLKNLAIAKAIKLKLLAIDFQTGSLLHTVDLTTVDRPDPIHSLNSYASPTPVIADQRIYCHFGTYGTFCLDRTNRQIIWSRALPLKHSVGPGSSPVFHNGKLVVIQDGLERQYVVALDADNGEEIWRTPRPPMRAADGEQRKAYCTPVLMTDSLGREQLVCLGSQWIVGLSPDSGRELWRLDHGDGFSVVPKPVVHGDLVIFSTGFGKPELWAVDATGSGDVSAEHVKWIVKKSIPAKPSPLLIEDRIYLVDDNGVTSCLDASGGEVVWRKRLGGNFSASPVYTHGRVYFANHDGEVFVLAPEDQYRLLATSELGEQIMASPAVVGDSLIVRTVDALYRFANPIEK